MKPSTVALVVIGVAGAGVGIYLLHKRAKDAAFLAGDAPPETAAPPPSSKGGLRGLEDQLGKSLGLPVPLSQIGSAAQNAPLALKLAVLPVGITALAQNVIDDPRGAAVAIGTGAKRAVTTVGSTAAAVATAPITAVTGLFSGPSFTEQIAAMKEKQAAKEAGFGSDLPAYRRWLLEKSRNSIASAMKGPASPWGSRTTIAVGG